VTDQSPVRRELEQSIRALLPDPVTAKRLFPSEPSAAAAAGLGGLLTGYVWGWFRGRRARARKRR
jgi:membrane associated rhomboid family serine protease